MRINRLKFHPRKHANLSTALLVLFLLVSGLESRIVRADSQNLSSPPRVNVPELTGVPFSPAIFWFGKVDQTNNYADVRIWYYDPDFIKIVVHVIDRQLWYDPSQNVADLTRWDALSIYLDLDGNTGPVPGSNSYLFQLQLKSDLRASFRGDGSTWTAANIPITSYSEWRGTNGPNSGLDSDGWVAYYIIPFSSLGLSGAPPDGKIWGLGVTLHDRDTGDGSIFHETNWPDGIAPNVPSTWGQLSFGAAKFATPRALPVDTVKIRQGLNGTTVIDGEVGGHTTCGNDGNNKWTEWGNFNYAGGTQFNIQNQWDVSDWHCFSKFYVTFPISMIPPGYTIISANLTMNLFGTAGGGKWGPPPDSYIEVLTVGKDWDESTLTWNNAPTALENISGIRVPPVVGAYTWDVGYAVNQAYTSGSPVRLVLYSIDSEKHSGKYFYSSDSNDWNGEIRPTLTVIYGNLCSSPDITCKFNFLPVIAR